MLLLIVFAPYDRSCEVYSFYEMAALLSNNFPEAVLLNEGEGRMKEAGPT